MKWFCKTKLKRFFRFIKKGIPVLRNKIFNQENNLDLLELSNNGYKPCTFIWEYQNENVYYGMADILRKYSGFKGSIPCTIEHGVYFGQGGAEELEKFNMPSIITFGEYREQSLKTVTDRPIFKIGPYIQYVDPYKDLGSIKKKIGITILVFPSHSIENNDVDYELDNFSAFIEDIKNKVGANTVLVSLYFKDLDKYRKEYENKGYTVVCSGFRTDKNFLSRQRSYIELADFVVTNSMGTHIGYAVSLNKPVSFYNQDLQFSYASEKIRDAIDPFKQQNEYTTNLMIIKKAFNGFNETITKEQKEIIGYYWGLGIKLSPKQMKSILDSSALILNKTFLHGTNYKMLFDKCCPKELSEKV